MSTCAVMVARDEADIVKATVRHTLWHVDEVIAADHRSVDGTREILFRLPVVFRSVLLRAFHGDRIWTWLAAEAFMRGHDWLLVVDADDIWHVAGDAGVRISDYLASLPGDVMVVGADSYNHIPTRLDPVKEDNPVKRIGWREVGWDAHKVACRLRPDLQYSNHGAWYGANNKGWFGEYRPPDIHSALTVRHFTIRTADQLVAKVRNGLDAFSEAAGMPEGYDESWTQWKGLSDDEIRQVFAERFFADDPETSSSLVYDPAPVKA